MTTVLVIVTTLFIISCVGNAMRIKKERALRKQGIDPKAERAKAAAAAKAKRDEAAAAAAAARAAANTDVPLKEWRGMGKMTRKDTVPCRCSKCSHRWQLDSAVSNSIANEQGVGGRMQRAGLKMEQTGASFTMGASGRRIAAGNELHRANEFLSNLYILAACPNCNSVDVLLTK